MLIVIMAPCYSSIRCLNGLAFCQGSAAILYCQESDILSSPLQLGCHYLSLRPSPRRGSPPGKNMLFFVLLPPECEGSSGSLELLSRLFDGTTSEGMRGLEVVLLHFRSSANVCHFKDARYVM